MIKALDLQKEGEEEKLKPALTFNPALQYQQQVVVQRILEPQNEDLPKLNEDIENYVRPDQELFRHAQNELQEFDQAFDIRAHEEEESKKPKRIYWRELIRQEEQK